MFTILPWASPNASSLRQVFVAVKKWKSYICLRRKLHLWAVSCIYAHIWLRKTWHNLFCPQKSKTLQNVACKNRKSCKTLHAKIDKVAKRCNKFLETAQNIELYIFWVFRKLYKKIAEICPDHHARKKWACWAAYNQNLAFLLLWKRSSPQW